MLHGDAPTSRGWYPDPADPALMHFWDGSAWTAQRPAQASDQPRPVRPYAGLARVVAAGIALDTVVLVVQVVVLSWGLSMFADAVGSGDVDRLDAFDHLRLGLVIADGALFIVTGICWAVWQSRVASRAHPGELERSPRLHGWSWFLPGVNLVLPFVNVRDLWRAFVSRRTALIGWWWACLVAADFVIPFFRPASSDDLGELRVSTSLDLASAVLGVVAAVLALRILRTLTAATVEREAGGPPVSAP